jgi:hemerythrin-like domain-containing protein
MHASKPDPDERADAVSVLLDDHAYGRWVLAEAARVLKTGGSDDDVAQVAASLHRFLTFTQPRHELDEEQRVFPALRAYGPKDEVDAALDAAFEAHTAFDALREKLARRWARVEAAPASLRALRGELLPLTEEFERALRRHADHEELVIYPLVRRLVPKRALARTA